MLPLFETGIPLLKQRLHQLSDADKVSISSRNVVWCKIYFLCGHGARQCCLLHDFY